MRRPRALKCPHCGGVVAPPLSSRRTACSHCSRPLFYSGDDFVPRFVLPPGLDEAEVQRRCREAFRSPYVPRDLFRKSLLLEKRRAYVPFFLLTGKRGGVLASRAEMPVWRQEDLEGPPMGPEDAGLGFPERAAWRTVRPEIGAEEQRRVALGDFRYLYSAAALGTWCPDDSGMRESVFAHLERAEPVLLADLARAGDVVDVTIPLGRLLERGVAATQKSGGVAVLEMHPVLVYLPLVTLTFRYGRHVFSVTLEETGGSWIGGTLPFRRDWAFLLGLGTVSLLALLVGRVGALFLSYDWSSFPLDRNFMIGLLFVSGAVTAAVSLVGFGAAWALVRSPYRVRQGLKGQRVELAGPVPRSPLKLVNGLLETLLGPLSGRKTRKGGGTP